MSVTPLPDAIELVEAHDATIGQLLVEPDSTLTLCFSSISVYARKPTSDERYDLWLCKADLVFDGVTHLEVRGCLVRGDRVSDIEVVEDDPRPLNLTEMLLVAPAAKIRILLAGSGSMVLVEYRSGQLKNLHAIELLEEWEGPLR